MAAGGEGSAQLVDITEEGGHPQADKTLLLEPGEDPGRVCRDTVHQKCQIDYQSHLLHEDTDILSSGICANP